MRIAKETINMKLDTSKYKLTIYTETTCPGCTELKGLLKDNSIPFNEKDITKGTTTTGPNIDNRWEFIDITTEIENFGKPILIPLMVVESTDNDTKYHGSNYDFDEPKEGIELLKQYCI